MKDENKEIEMIIETGEEQPIDEQPKDEQPEVEEPKEELPSAL